MVYQGEKSGFCMATRMKDSVLILIISTSPRYLEIKADFYSHTAVALLKDFYFLLNSFLIMPKSKNLDLNISLCL